MSDISRAIPQFQRPLHILMLPPSKFPAACPPGWRQREIPNWLLGIDPGLLTQTCYVRPDGVIVVSK